MSLDLASSTRRSASSSFGKSLSAHLYAVRLLYALREHASFRFQHIPLQELLKSVMASCPLFRQSQWAAWEYILMMLERRTTPEGSINTEVLPVDLDDLFKQAFSSGIPSALVLSFGYGIFVLPSLRFLPPPDAMDSLISPVWTPTTFELRERVHVFAPEHFSLQITRRVEAWDDFQGIGAGRRPQFTVLQFGLSCNARDTVGTTTQEEEHEGIRQGRSRWKYARWSTRLFGEWIPTMIDDASEDDVLLLLASPSRVMLGARDPMLSQNVCHFCYDEPVLVRSICVGVTRPRDGFVDESDRGTSLPPSTPMASPPLPMLGSQNEQLRGQTVLAAEDYASALGRRLQLNWHPTVCTLSYVALRNAHNSPQTTRSSRSSLERHKMFDVDETVSSSFAAKYEYFFTPEQMTSLTSHPSPSIQLSSTLPWTSTQVTATMPFLELFLDLVSLAAFANESLRLELRCVSPLSVERDPMQAHYRLDCSSIWGVAPLNGPNPFGVPAALHQAGGVKKEEGSDSSENNSTESVSGEDLMPPWCSDSLYRMFRSRSGASQTLNIFMPPHLAASISLGIDTVHNAENGDRTRSRGTWGALGDVWSIAMTCVWIRRYPYSKMQHSAAPGGGGSSSSSAAFGVPIVPYLSGMMVGTFTAYLETLDRLRRWIVGEDRTEGDEHVGEPKDHFRSRGSSSANRRGAGSSNEKTRTDPESAPVFPSTLFERQLWSLIIAPQLAPVLKTIQHTLMGNDGRGDGPPPPDRDAGPSSLSTSSTRLSRRAAPSSSSSSSLLGSEFVELLAVTARLLLADASSVCNNSSSSPDGSPPPSRRCWTAASLLHCELRCHLERRLNVRATTVVGPLEGLFAPPKDNTEDVSLSSVDCLTGPFQDKLRRTLTEYLILLHACEPHSAEQSWPCRASSDCCSVDEESPPQDPTRISFNHSIPLLAPARINQSLFSSLNTEDLIIFRPCDATWGDKGGGGAGWLWLDAHMYQVRWVRRMLLCLIPPPLGAIEVHRSASRDRSEVHGEENLRGLLLGYIQRNRSALFSALLLQRGAWKDSFNSVELPRRMIRQLLLL